MMASEQNGRYGVCERVIGAWVDCVIDGAENARRVKSV
jgi:hypothetical protein